MCAVAVEPVGKYALFCCGPVSPNTAKGDALLPETCLSKMRKLAYFGRG